MARPRLVRYLEEWLNAADENREWPRDAFAALAAIGPGAAEALPVLERIRSHGAVEGTPLPERNEFDPLDQAVLAVRGELKQ